MKDNEGRSTSAVVIGVGSDHGDDQLGWQAVRLLRRHARFTQKAVEVQDTTRLIDHLAGCDHLVVVDACWGGAAPGTISRLPWPNPGIELQQGNSTHGVGVADALRLAEQLGVLPRRVVVFGVEGADYQPAGDMSPAVREVLPELVERVVEELESKEHGAGSRE
jgi:hydrogenase maturation protease